MLKTILSFMLAVGPTAPFTAMAHELDRENVISADQRRLSQNLPQTVVIREDNQDPANISVAHVKEKLPAAAVPAHVTFETAALNAETRGLPYDSTNELDQTSSTNAWAFGLGLGLGFLGGGLFASSRAYAATPYYYGGYGYNDYRVRSAYVPYYRYAGYNYAYTNSYYRYATPRYTYTYCNWPNAYY